MIEQHRNDTFGKLMSRNYANLCEERIWVSDLRGKTPNPSTPFLLILCPYVGFDETRKSLKGERFIGLPSRVMIILLRFSPTWQGIP